MREIFLNTWLLVTLAAAALAASLVGSALTEESHWFARSGAVVTVLGLLLTIKHNVLSSSRDINAIVAEKRHYAYFAPDKDSPVHQKDLQMARHIMRDEYLGLAFTVVGTVVWGYGDIVYGWVT